MVKPITQKAKTNCYLAPPTGEVTVDASGKKVAKFPKAKLLK